MSLSKTLASCGRILARQTMSGGAPAAAFGRLAMRESRPTLVKMFSTKTKGDEELSTFLSDEIAAEKKARKHSGVPKVDGFEVSPTGSDVKLTRRFNDETITVELNVNHTVDANDDAPPAANNADVGQMLSKPNFDVVIEKADGQKMLLSCSFAVHDADQQNQDGYDDMFQIVEFSMYSGAEIQDSDYSVSGDIMDAHLYDLLMNLLEERGVTNEFAEQLVELSTSYEHGLYIGLLEKLKDFVSK